MKATIQCLMKKKENKMPRGNGQGRGNGVGRGYGQGRGQGGNNAGPGGYCVCPSCGHREAHVTGTPCMNRTCPQCGTKMTRE